MNKNVLCLFLFVFSITYLGCNAIKKQSIKADKGKIDFTNWNFEKSGIVKLDGQWEVYWGELLTPDEIKSRESKSLPDYINIPNSAGKKTFNGKTISVNDFGTLKLKIKTNNKNNLNYMLRTSILFNSHKIWIDGELVSEIGKVANNEKEFRASWKTSLVNIESKKSDIEVVIQVANFDDVIGTLRSPSFGTQENIFKNYLLDIVKDVFIIGSLFFMGIYHLVLYKKRKKDKSTLFLGITALFMASRIILAGTNLVYQIYPKFNWALFNKLCYVSVCFIVISYFMFLKEIFIDISDKFIKFTKVISVIIVTITVTTNIVVFNKFYILFEVLVVLGLIYILFIVIKETINKNKYGIIFIVGIFIMLVSSIYDIFVNLGIINTNGILPVGLFVFMFFQAYMIASKFSNAFAEAEALTEEVKGLNNELEIKVEERTKELSDTLEELKKSQGKMIESEKMAALGQLIAGIAHEINTPLGAIRASIGNIADSFDYTITKFPNLIKETSDENLEILNKIIIESKKNVNMLMGREARKLKKQYIEYFENNDIGNADYIGDALIDMGIEGNVEYLMPMLRGKDGFEIMKAARDLCLIQKNSKNIEIAVDKAAKVVYALKIYAHHEEAKIIKNIDIVENIEVVLTLYHNQIKYGVEVVKEYGKVSPVLGFPDELNQIWTNIIHNAIQAMDNKGTMTIRVFEENNYVKVAISDTGSGITEENMGKIFKPFFTTKNIGEGTGLGLDIVKKIIDKHEGLIECKSIVDAGTTFTISIPKEKNIDAVY